MGHWETVVRIFTEIQTGVAVVGRRKKGKGSLCSVPVQRKKGEAWGVHKTILLHLPSPTIAFLIRRPTQHQKAHFPAAGCGLCTVNLNAITNHSTHLLSPRQKAPVSPLEFCAQRSALICCLSPTTPFQQQRPIERDAAKGSIRLVSPLALYSDLSTCLHGTTHNGL